MSCEVYSNRVHRVKGKPFDRRRHGQVNTSANVKLREAVILFNTRLSGIPGCIHVDPEEHRLHDSQNHKVLILVVWVRVVIMKTRGDAWTA